MKTFCKLTTQSPAASYVPLPRFLLQDEALRDISNDAKVLYALLLDRASISRQNGYVEPDGTIRLYFTLEQAQTKLHRSRQSATRIFRELEYSGLIIRKKQGLGKPALITLNYLWNRYHRIHGFLSGDGIPDGKRRTDSILLYADVPCSNHNGRMCCLYFPEGSE